MSEALRDVGVVAEPPIDEFFRLAGLKKVRVARTAEDLDRSLSEFFSYPSLVLVLVSEKLATEHPQVLSKYAPRAPPFICTFPSLEGPSPLLIETLRRAIRRAVGVEVQL